MHLDHAYISVEHKGRFRYAATVMGRPDSDIDSVFDMPIMERGPYHARSHRRAWRKAWNDVGRPTIVPLDDL